MAARPWPRFARILRSKMTPEPARLLREDGFAVIPGPVPPGDLERLARAYDQAMIEAHPDDRSIGSSTTRVHDFVNRGPEFDCLYIHPPILAACDETIGQPFKLSSMLGRTLRPQAIAQRLHVDYRSDESGWTMVGFIFMIDEFKPDNGATRFLPGSHQSSRPPDVTAHIADDQLVPACGPAGSVIVFNGSVWHAHGADQTDMPRRSIQGAYIRRNAQSGIDFASRMRPETLARIGSLAKYLLAI